MKREWCQIAIDIFVLLHSLLHSLQSDSFFFVKETRFLRWFCKDAIHWFSARFCIESKYNWKRIFHWIYDVECMKGLLTVELPKKNFCWLLYRYETVYFWRLERVFVKCINKSSCTPSYCIKFLHLFLFSVSDGNFVFFRTDRRNDALDVVKQFYNIDTFSLHRFDSSMNVLLFITHRFTQKRTETKLTILIEIKSLVLGDASTCEIVPRKFESSNVAHG